MLRDEERARYQTLYKLSGLIRKDEGVASIPPWFGQISQQ